MKTKVYILSGLLITLCLFSGCTSFDVGNWFSSDPKANEEKAAEKVADQQTILQVELDNQKNDAAKFVYGTNASLVSIKDKSLEVNTAISLNKRAQVILGLPSQKDILSIESLVKNMNSVIADERKKAESQLAEYDAKIVDSQNKVIYLQKKLDEAYEKYENVAKKNAKTAGEYSEYKDKMESWFGFGAIFYGFKRFIISCITIILVVSVIFLILRVCASMNPIAGALFGVFEGIVASVLKMVSGLFPKAMEMAGRIHISDFNAVKQSRNKMIDVIEEFKRDMKKNPTQVYTIMDLLEKLNDEFGDDDKAEIERALKSLKWKK